MRVLIIIAGAYEDHVVPDYLWVDEWARVEELWDLEEAWLAGNDPSVAGRVTRSVAGTFFDMYCGRWRNGKNKSSDYVTKHKTIRCTSACVNFDNVRKSFQKLTSTIGISSGPGPGWLGPLARLRLGCSGHMFCRRWLCIFFLCFLLCKYFVIVSPLCSWYQNISHHVKKLFPPMLHITNTTRSTFWAWVNILAKCRLCGNLKGKARKGSEIISLTWFYNRQPHTRCPPPTEPHKYPWLSGLFSGRVPLPLSTSHPQTHRCTHTHTHTHTHNVRTVRETTGKRKSVSSNGAGFSVHLHSFLFCFLFY